MPRQSRRAARNTAWNASGHTAGDRATSRFGRSGRPATSRFGRCSGRPAAAGAGHVRTDGNSLRFAAQDQGDASFGIELHDLIRRSVDRPHVVLRIDAQADRGVETVHILPKLANELAALIELEEPRSAAGERAVIAERGVGMPRARVDEDLPL